MTLAELGATPQSFGSSRALFHQQRAPHLREPWKQWLRMRPPALRVLLFQRFAVLRWDAVQHPPRVLGEFLLVQSTSVLLQDHNRFARCG